MMRDGSGSEISKDDKVTLLRVTDAMISGLPMEESNFLRSKEGTTVSVSDFDEQDIEVMITNENSGTVHFLRVAREDIEYNDVKR